MKKKWKVILLIVLGLLTLILYWYYQQTTEPVAYKPNIYLYPEHKTELEVHIDFPSGGKILKSIPEYQQKWKVTVEPSGKINQQHDYLFYESQQPDGWQRTRGWCIEQGKLGQFFPQIMSAHGFNENEVKDFTEHWIPRLKKYAFYTIYPQYNKELEPLISLHVSGNPIEIFRVHFLIEGSDAKTIPYKIQVSEAKRNGFHVMEWGVLMDQPE